MNYSTHQIHAGPAMGMFNQTSRTVEVTGSAPMGCLNCAQPKSMLAGLGDVGSDFANVFGSIINGVTSVIGGVTGSTAQAKSQADMIALAKVQADRAAAEAAASSQMMMYGALGVGILGLGLIMVLKK